jgi:hypothetical protein
MTPLRGKNMKFLILSLILGSNLALAATFKVDGSAQNLFMTVRGEKTHTEYREETESYTCYESVFDGYREVCSSVGGGEECGVTPSGRQCFPVPPHQECSNEPVYREVETTCHRTVQVPYEVKDYDVETDVNVVVFPSAIGALDETLQIDQRGESVRVLAQQTSKKALIYSQAEYKTISFNGSLKKMESTVTIAFESMEKYASPMMTEMSELTTDGSSLSFTLGRVYLPENLSISADIFRYFLIIPHRLLNRKLTAEEYMIEDAGQGLSRVKIDFNKLGLTSKMRGKTVHFKIGIRLQVPQENLINGQDLPDLSDEKKLKQVMPK